MHEIANDIDSMISFTYDVPSNHDQNKLPVLDLNVYLDQNDFVYHEFYEKSTKNNLVTLASSALSLKTKRTVFTQEALRRLRNTSISLGPEIANKFLSEYMLKLKDSGYNKRFRTQILKSAKNAFEIQKENDKVGLRPLFRDKQRIILDQKQRGKGQADWWNQPHYKNPEVQKYDTILFVPPTPGGALAKQMQVRENQINSGTEDRIKIVERGGIKLKRILVQKNPYPKMPCNRPLCPFCGSTLVSNPAKSNLPCNTPGVGYQITCLNCKAQDHISRYEGKTGQL